MLPSLSEIARALHGTVLLIRGHPDAPLMFDRSAGGFWRSLFAAVLVLPGHCYMTWQTLQESPAERYGFHAGATDLLIYIIIWLAYPAAMAHWTNALDRDDRLLDYLVPYNWMTVPVAYLYVLATALTTADILPGSVEIAVSIGVYGATLLILLELARRQLSVGIRIAFAIVCFDFVLTVAIMTLLKSFAGR